MQCRAQFATNKFPPKTCRVRGKHWPNKICPACTKLGFRKADDPRLSANKQKKERRNG